MFTYGDIVKPTFGSNGVEYYIIVDVIDFSKKNDGSDINYEVMRIFPITKVSKVEGIDEKRLSLVAKVETKESVLIMDFVRRKRLEKGWTEVPDFVAHIYHNQRVATGTIVLVDEEDTDEIRYDQLETIDDCLDRMNDLKDLHNVFGDESYLQLREVVQNRLKELI